MRITILIICIAFIILLESFIIPSSYQAYIDEHLFKAQELERAYGIPVSIQFAQAIYESGAGRSNIAQNSCNHFGIRCGDDWEGERYCSKSGCWRAYDNVGLSWLDHAAFIANYYPNAMHQSWEFYETLEGYGEAGYWKKITKIVKRYKLYKYDTQYACN